MDMKKGYVAVRFMTPMSGNQFEDKEYYFVNRLELKEEDVVVVDTKYGMALGIVSQLFDIYPIKPQLKGIILKEVIAKVDLTAFKARQELNARIDELKAAMDKRIADMKEIQLYETFAAGDPTLKKMLDELMGLDG